MSNNKRKFVSSESSEAAEKEKRLKHVVYSQEDEAKGVAEHYNLHAHRSLNERKEARAFQLFKLNNWIKSVMIETSMASLTHNRDGTTNSISVLDLCGGKGGDLKKFKLLDYLINYYVLADIASESLKDAVGRYNDIMKRGKGFPAQFICGNLLSARITEHLHQTVEFDLVSCQLAFHYSFKDEKSARRLLENASDRLRVGGKFIGTMSDGNVLLRHLQENPRTRAFKGSLYKVEFDRKAPEINKEKSPFGHRYIFALEGAINDCPEYLVHVPTLETLAMEYGLKLIMYKNFHNYFFEYADKGRHPLEYELLHKIGVLENGKIKREDWEVANLYTCFVFHKENEGTFEKAARRGTTARVPANSRSAQEDDIIYI